MEGLTPAITDRLVRSRIIWLTTVTPGGQPQTSPVWFLWQDGRLLIYSAVSPRVRNLRANPRVSLNLDGDGRGGGIVTLEGIASLEEDGPPSTAVPDYLAKYLPLITANGWTADWFAGAYPARIVVTPTRLRAY